MPPGLRHIGLDRPWHPHPRLFRLLSGRTEADTTPGPSRRRIHQTAHNSASLTHAKHMPSLRHPRIHLVSLDLAPPAGVAGDGWLARVLGEPPIVDGLGVAVAGEWMEGYALGD